MCSPLLGGSEIRAENAGRLKLLLTIPLPFCQRRLDERSSSILRLAPAPWIALCNRVLAGYNNQPRRPLQRSRASAEWSPLVHGECARLRATSPPHVFSH